MMNRKPNLFIVIADCLLESDQKTKSWSSEKDLRTSWYWLCGLIVALFVIGIIFKIPLRGIAGESHEVTLIFRWLFTGLFLGFIVITFYFTYFYAKFALSHRGRLHLRTVFGFYLLTVIGFAGFYYFLYFIDPTLFSYPGSPINPTPFTDTSLENYIMMLEFILFSAQSSLNTQYHGISANSASISVALYAQSLYTLSLVAVLIAGYVNQTFEYIDEDRSGD